MAVISTAMRNTGADIGFADMVRLNEDGAIEQTGVLAQRGFPESAGSCLVPEGSGVFTCRSEFLGFMLSTYAVVAVQTAIWSRSLLTQERVWFDETLTCGEDLDLFYRLMARARAVFVHETVAVMRKHPRSITARLPVETVIDGVRVRERYLAEFNDRLRRSDIRSAEAFIAKSLCDVGYAAWATGHSASARRYYRHSFKAHPSKSAAVGYLKAMVPRAPLVALLQRSPASASDV
jgi:hypothetical protein